MRRVRLCNHRDYAHQAPLSMGYLQARLLEQVDISSKGSSSPRDRTPISRVSCTGRQVLGQRATRGALGCCCSVAKLYLTLCNYWTVACQASLSFAISWSLPKFMSFESVTLSNHLILCHPLLPCLRSFLASRSFPVSRLFASSGQSIGASERVLLINIQGWFPLGLTGLIPLLFKGLSRIFSGTTVWKSQFFSAQSSLWSSSHICIWLLENP